MLCVLVDPSSLPFLFLYFLATNTFQPSHSASLWLQVWLLFRLWISFLPWPQIRTPDSTKAFKLLRAGQNSIVFSFPYSEFRGFRARIVPCLGFWLFFCRDGWVARDWHSCKYKGFWWTGTSWISFVVCTTKNGTD